MIKIRRRKPLNESKFLNESQESKSIAAMKRLYRELGYKEENFEKTLNRIRDTFPVLRTKEGGKFILGTFRMYVRNMLSGYPDFVLLNQILKIIVASHIDEYDRNLNGESFGTLKRRFGGDIKNNIESDKKQISELRLTGKSDYTVRKISSFEDAKKYHDYCDWCITYREDMWATYTVDGQNAFYFMLKPGFENIERTEGENCPNDEYGLSMIAVSVCPDGSINSSTCRWNHDHGATDSQFDAVALSRLLQKDFYSVFKPNETESTSGNSREDALDKIRISQFRFL